MVLFRNKNYYLWLSLIIAFGIAAVQVLNSTIGILFFIVSFFVLILFGATNDMVMPILLFFLPWSKLLKIRPGTISMYTVALVVVLLIYAFRNSRKFSIIHVFPAALLFAQTLIVKTVTDDPIDNGYILFFLCMFLFPLIASEKEKEYDFFTLMLFFTLGIVTAALSAKQLVVFPTISRYITVDSYSSLTRLSGFYGDPNFYAAHITAALSGVMVLLLHEHTLLRKIVLYVSLIVLVYCGLLSVSKTFILIFICVTLLWIIEILFRKGRISSKLMLLLALLIGTIFVLSSVLFTDLIDMMIGRFFGSNAGSTISDFTTGRTDLWMVYLREFEAKPMVLLFGRGFTDDLVGNYSSHNIVIQSIYQFGLVGNVSLIIWIWIYYKNMLGSIKLYMNDVAQWLIFLGGVFGPWLSLDSLKFDEFFLMPFYVFVGISYIVYANNDYWNNYTVDREVKV